MRKNIVYAVACMGVAAIIFAFIYYQEWPQGRPAINVAALFCIVLAFLGLTLGLISIVVQPHKRFSERHKSWFSIHDQNDIKRMWKLFGISLAVALLLFATALSYVLIWEVDPENRTAAYATGISFIVGLMLNLAIYYWSFGTNLAQMRATRMIENLMSGITTLGEDTAEQLFRLREYLEIGKGNHGDNWLRMAVASPAFGILHSLEAVKSFLQILEDWLEAAETSNNNQLELIFWSRDEHRKDFGATSNLPVWKDKRKETIEVLCGLAHIFSRISSLRKDGAKNVNINIWEARRSDYRICIAGSPSSPLVRVALILYAPLDKELRTGAQKVESLFFQYQRGQGKSSLITIYERHKGSSMDASCLNVELYLNNPVLFLEDFFEISEPEKQAVASYLRETGALGETSRANPSRPISQI